MCNFFSFVGDGKGNYLYTDAIQRYMETNAPENKRLYIAMQGAIDRAIGYFINQSDFDTGMTEDEYKAVCVQAMMVWMGAIRDYGFPPERLAEPNAEIARLRGLLAESRQAMEGDGWESIKTRIDAELSPEGKGESDER
jgi:hypothetical protein